MISFTVSDAVLLAAIGLANTIVLRVFAAKDRRKDSSDRSVLAEKVDAHNEVVNQKLDTNTKITAAGAAKASQAYEEANNFNRRLAQLEGELKDNIGKELGRLSFNIHALRNALTGLTGKPIEMQARPGSAEPGDSKEKT